MLCLQACFFLLRFRLSPIIKEKLAACDGMGSTHNMGRNFSSLQNALQKIWRSATERHSTFLFPFALCYTYSTQFLCETACKHDHRVRLLVIGLLAAAAGCSCRSATGLAAGCLAAAGLLLAARC